MPSNELLINYLGEFVAVASAPRTLWRTIALNPTIGALSRASSVDALETQLSKLLKTPRLEDRELTLAYCLLIALLLKSPIAGEGASKIDNIDKLPLAQGLIDARREQSLTFRVDVPLQSGTSLKQRTSTTKSGTNRLVESLEDS